MPERIQSTGDIRGQLPARVTRVLDEFVAASREAFGEALVAAVLFGSAAEGRLRPVSDVNLVLVLRSFAPVHAKTLEPRLRFSEAAIRLRVMFLLEPEITAAASAFAQKFADIGARRLVWWGETDPFANLAVPREALARQIEQVLLNLTLRLRERAARDWSHDDVLRQVLTDAVGPLRASAQGLFAINGQPATSPKAALAALAAMPGAPHPHLAHYFSSLREGEAEAGTAGAALMATIELIAWMRSWRGTSHESI